ncbi:hypothetical protein EVAR_37355_1 [Eumeta japonica]|uniref:Uncharacterized protein n=1 Tax=Eumeta variegata TaxID=151549 RepID=A0A4C1WZK8_EUMVA|nr:hypothetical protein EVAR_37355_1 [Eumeta japonica]
MQTGRQASAASTDPCRLKTGNLLVQLMNSVSVFAAYAERHIALITLRTLFFEPTTLAQCALRGSQCVFNRFQKGGGSMFVNGVHVTEKEEEANRQEDG